MSFFNANATGGAGGGAAGGLVTKFEKIINIGTSELAKVTIDLSSDISNYADITNEQIIVELKGVAANFSDGNSGVCTLEHSYNAESGELTITSSSSRMPFSYSSADELSVDIFVAGAVQMPAPPIIEPVESITVNSKAGTQANSTNSRWNFVVNVGQMAILTSGYSSNWKVSNEKAILSRQYGTANDVGDRTNQGKDNYVIIVMPTEDTGAVACSTELGGVTFTGGTYTILDIE